MDSLTYIPLTDMKHTASDEVALKPSFVIEESFPEENLFDVEDGGFRFISFEPTISNSGKTVILESERQEEQIIFEMNLNIWNNQTSLMANNNFDNLYFKEIVKMGEKAVPFILRELKKGATPLVHALDLIYPGTIEYKGYIPLGAICSLWEDLLIKKGIE